MQYFEKINFEEYRVSLPSLAKLTSPQYEFYISQQSAIAKSVQNVLNNYSAPFRDINYQRSIASSNLQNLISNFSNRPYLNTELKRTVEKLSVTYKNSVFTNQVHQIVKESPLNMQTSILQKQIENLSKSVNYQKLFQSQKFVDIVSPPCKAIMKARQSPAYEGQRNADNEIENTEQKKFANPTNQAHLWKSLLNSSRLSALKFKPEYLGEIFWEFVISYTALHLVPATTYILMQWIAGIIVYIQNLPNS